MTVWIRTVTVGPTFAQIMVGVGVLLIGIGIGIAIGGVLNSWIRKGKA